MNRQRLLYIGLALGALLLVLQVVSLSSPAPAESPEALTQRLSTERADKDRWMKTAADSPLPDSARAGFTGLPYYPIDAAYCVPAQLVRAASGDSITLSYTRNQTDRLGVAGTLSFTLRGRELSLIAYYETGSTERLFVPFTDSTSGGETYGGGRYLQLEAKGGRWTIDFNAAYHPYCVYDVEYVCPIPPRENRRPLAIRAGERLVGS